jgi:histidyl-tRNA synthetase
MKKADGSGAAFAVIIGEDEVANNRGVKALRGGGAQQQAWPSTRWSTTSSTRSSAATTTTTCTTTCTIIRNSTN